MLTIQRKRTAGLLAALILGAGMIGSLTSCTFSDSSSWTKPEEAAQSTWERTGDGSQREIELGEEEAWNRTSYTSDARLIPDEAMAAGVGTDIPEGMEPIAQREELVLYFNPKDTTFAVESRESGRVWTSAPRDMALDKVAKGDNFTRLYASVLVEYYSESGALQTFDSYNHSVMLDNFSFEKKENGVDIAYRIGRKKTVSSADVPNIISRERLEYFLNKMEGSKRSDTKSRYRLYSLQNARTEEARQKMIREYPTIVNGDIYVLKDKEDKLLYIIRDNLAEVGYTTEDLERDNREHNIQTETEEEQIFQVILSIELDQYGLVAKVDGSRLKSPSKTPIHTLHILPFFGAANLASRGYMLVPDGSGGLVYLNSFSSSTQNLVLPLYGRDDALRQSSAEAGQQPVSLPVYGMKNGEAAFWAVIEKGDGVGSINCAVPGRQNSYNCVWPSFTLNPRDSFEALQTGNLGGGVLTTLYPEKPYAGQLSVSYRFLEGASANYSGMAAAYRAYLQQKNLLTADRVTVQEMPFILETVGAIDKQAAALGLIPYDKIVPLTTFEQTEQIWSRLKENGIHNIHLRLCGWMNGGMGQSPADTVTVVEALGGEKGLQKMLEAAKKDGVALYADLQLQTIRNAGSLYPQKERAVRYLGNVYASLYQYDIPSGNILKGTKEYLLSPSCLPALAETVSAHTELSGVEGISLEKIGSRLYSDFNVRQFSTRDDSLEHTKDALAVLSRSHRILVDGANAYTFAEASLLINIPMSGSGYRRINAEVPFLQMVLHGYLPYAGTPQNHTDDPQMYRLKCVEYGAVPYYQWSYQSGTATRGTNYSAYYALGYESTWNAAVRDYARRNETMGVLSGSTITNHRELAPQVYATCYDNGRCVVVNYNSYDAVIHGTVVAAYDWAVMEGETLC